MKNCNVHGGNMYYTRYDNGNWTIMSEEERQAKLIEAKAANSQEWLNQLDTNNFSRHNSLNIAKAMTLLNLINDLKKCADAFNEVKDHEVFVNNLDDIEGDGILRFKINKIIQSLKINALRVSEKDILK